MEATGTTESAERAAPLARSERPGRIVPRKRGVLDGIVATVAVSGLSLLRGKRGITLAVLCALPLIAPALELFKTGAGAKGAVGFLQTIGEWSLARINLITVLFLGCGALGEEIEGKTLPYLLTRPLPRSALLLGRWLSSAVAGFVLLGASTTAVYLACVGQMGSEALWIDLPSLGWSLVALGISLLAYTAFFMLLSIVIKWPLIVGLALLFGWEEFAAKLPGPAAHYTLLHHIYSLMAHWSGDAAFHELASPYGEKLLPAATSVHVLLWVAGVSLALALWRFRKRPYLV